MADPAEVRAWARDNGLEVSARGAIPSHITEAYEAVQGAAGNGSYADPGDNAGVTEADFPPPLEDGDETGSAAPKAPRERRPRAVRPSRAKGKGWRNVFGGAPGAKAKSRGGPRTDLSEFAEDTWRDLAMLSAGVLPPVSKVLTIQAPYAGVVFDEAVRGIPLVDAVLQPIARTSVSLRALNGLLGPAFFTTAICVQGEWVLNEDKSPVIGPDGRPIPTQRTALMLGGLKYSLLQMSRTADLSKVQERAEVDAERMRAVDKLVDFIFGFPAAQAQDHSSRSGNAQPQQEGPRMPRPDAVLIPTMTYPPPPQMDDLGARP